MSTPQIPAASQSPLFLSAVSEKAYCALSSTLFRGFEVPLTKDQVRYIRKRGVMPRWPDRGKNGQSGGQGVHREVESEGHEEKYRAVTDGGYSRDQPADPRNLEAENLA